VDGSVIGLAFDGTGYGIDGKIWGGEILTARLDGFERVGHLAYTAMPGGAAAIREPWRMALSYLYQIYGEGLFNLNLPMFEDLERKNIETIMAMIEKKLNSPYTSSLGRLFDGIAALVGVRGKVAYEGQAAMELEMLADPFEKGDYEYSLSPGETLKIEPESIIRGVVEDIQKGVPTGGVSMKFHRTLIRMFTAICSDLRNDTGLNRVALSGGVFQNTILLSGLIEKLDRSGFEVLSHTKTPTNDGGVALGQAVVADAMISSL